jgi:hypothetical protein
MKDIGKHLGNISAGTAFLHPSMLGLVFPPEGGSHMQKVKRFVEARGSQMDYTVALDAGGAATHCESANNSL